MYLFNWFAKSRFLLYGLSWIDDLGFWEFFNPVGVYNNVEIFQLYTSADIDWYSKNNAIIAVLVFKIIRSICDLI